MTSHVALSAIADHLLQLKTLDSASLKHIEDCLECRSDFQWLKVLRGMGRPESMESSEGADLA